MASNTFDGLWSVGIVSPAKSVTVHVLAKAFNMPSARIRIPKVENRGAYYAFINDFDSEKVARDFADQWSNRVVFDTTIKCKALPPRSDDSEDARPDSRSSDQRPQSNPASEKPKASAEAIIDPSRDELLKKQAASKAYYDSFPNIDDATNETRPDIKKAEEFTKAILNNLPSGNPTERDTLCHVLNKLVGQQNQQCLFYDSANGINLHDASGNLVNADSKDKPFVLKLESSKGLGDGKSPKADEDDLKLVETLTSLIEQKKSHSIIEDVRDRLAKAYGVEKNYIIIENFYFGSFNIVYTVLNLAATAVQALQQISQKLRAQFHQFVSAKIHPLLYRPAFDISCFDARGNKTFSNQAETHQVGPPGRTKTYTTAAGWTRYGLNVLSKYGNDDWLHPFGHAGNWYRAFHGTRNAQAAFLRDYDVRRDNTGPVSLLAVADIYKGGFQPSSDGRYGSGVYCSPNPTFPERGYIREVVINTKQGMKNFKFMLQVAVNPDGVTFGNADIWVVPRSQDIRPYGILIKGV